MNPDLAYFTQNGSMELDESDLPYFTQNDSIELDKSLFTQFYLDPEEPKNWNPFYTKVLSVLDTSAFELPKLNQLKWPGWPCKKPKKTDRNQFKTLFPDLETGPLKEKNLKKMLKRFDKLVSLMEFDSNDGRKIFLQKLKSDTDVYSKMKILVSCYITGQKMLKKRLAIDSWKIFTNDLENLQSSFLNVKNEKSEDISNGSSTDTNVENEVVTNNNDSSTDLDLGTAMPSLIHSAQQALYSILPTSPTKL